MDTTNIYIGRIEFIGTAEGSNTAAKRAALCAKAREVSSVGAREKRPNLATVALVERNERLAQRLAEARERHLQTRKAVFGW